MPEYDPTGIETREQLVPSAERCGIRLEIESEGSSNIIDVLKDAMLRTGMSDFPLTQEINGRYIIDIPKDRIRLSKIHNFWFEFGLLYMERIANGIGRTDFLENVDMYVQSIKNGEKGGEITIELLTNKKVSPIGIKREIIEGAKEHPLSPNIQMEAIEKEMEISGVQTERGRRFIISTGMKEVEWGDMSLLIGHLDDELGRESSAQSALENITEKGIGAEPEGANIVMGESYITCRVVR